MRARLTGIIAGAIVMASGVLAMAAVDHTEFVKGPFKTGPDVTKVCLECHEKQATDVMKTTHWKFKGTPNHIKGMEKSKQEFGKANMINNFCTSIQGGPDGLVHETCDKCHAGYDWTRTNYDFTDKTKVDCLVCHALKGNYSKGVVGCNVDMKAMGKRDHEFGRGSSECWHAFPQELRLLPLLQWWW